jgi:hypothetical protein
MIFERKKIETNIFSRGIICLLINYLYLLTEYFPVIYK